jgi:long-chain fatty acid transport protein
MYGMGARNVARGNASTALAEDAWTSFYNPAGVARLRHVSLEASYILGQANLRPFERIVYDRNGDGQLSDADGFAETGPVGADYRARNTGPDRPFHTDGIQFAIAYPLGWRFGIGVAGFLPREGLLRLALENPALPYYVVFRNRNNRFTLSPALGMQIVEGVSIGVGAEVAAQAKLYAQASANANVDAFAEGSDTDLVADLSLDIQAFEASAVPKVQPTAGLQVSLGAFVPRDKPELRELLDRFAIGLTYRGRWGVDTSAEVVAGVNGEIRFDDETLLLSSLLEEPLALTIEDLLAFYNPPRVNLGFTGGYRFLQLSFDAQWTKWSGFQELSTPATTLAIDAVAGTSINVDIGTPLPPPAFRDTWTIRTGLDVDLDLLSDLKAVDRLGLHLGLGYGFVPSPVPPQTGLTNYMDADRHALSFGAGVELGHIKGVTKGPVRFDFAGQYHALTTTTSIKEDGLVSDGDGDGRLDYPSGYPLDGEITAGGSAWALMGSVSVAFGDPTQVRRRKDRALDAVEETP